MSHKPEWPPSSEGMNALLPAFEFTAMVTSNDLGAVFFANQKSLDRQVTVKVFSPELAADPQFRKAFGNSSKIAAGLRHTNLIGILDSGEAGGLPYLVMEFVPGKSLARSTKGQIVEFGQSLSIIDAICEGLAHAHDSGLVHGHLDNLSILLNQNAVPKIGNFGFGRVVHTDPQVHSPTHFTAPEVLANPSAAAKAADVFSIAAIFYGLITGKPYSPSSPPASSVCGCRPAVDSVLKRATDQDPLKRYADARAFQSALNQATGKPAAKAAPAAAAAANPAASPAENPPPPPPTALPKAGSDSKLLVKIAIIIVLLVAIFFTWELQKKVRADREKENREIIVKEKLAKEQAAALIAARKAEEKAMEKPKRPVSRPDPDDSLPENKEVEESPEDSLDRLRSALVDGDRSEMPVGSVKKGDRSYFLVEEEMTWAEASHFAEEHGAHLADPSADLSWLDAELTKGRPCWLGAARSGSDSWVLCDGKPWSPSVQPEGDGPFLLSARSGAFASADGSRPRPFVIEWRDDGSNPGSLANLLAATRASLKEPSPVFPPGTLVSGARRYLFVKRPVTWSEAAELAEEGGGHLLVAASQQEIAEVAELTKRIKVEDGIWLGGSMEDDLWAWVTAEPWKAAAWVDESDALEEGTALALRPRDGWFAMDRGDTVDGFIIEWSEDEKAPKTNTPAPADKIAELDVRVKELILAATKKSEEEHASNIKKLHWDLDSYLRSLSGSGKAQFGSSVEDLKEMVDDNRLDIDEIREKSNNRQIIASMEMLKLVNYHCDKQLKIDTQAAEGITKIRDAYVTRLTVIRDEAKVAGQPKIVADLEDIIEDAEDLDSWAESFDGVEE